MKHGPLLLLVAALLPLAAAADQCLVVGVSDGDTLTARCGQFGAYQQIKVRLSGIDAPERAQAFGARAKEEMSGLVFGKMANLDCPKKDRYSRSVCSVLVAPASAPDGPQTLDAGLAMVTQGMAWWYRAYAREQSPKERDQYAFAEKEARAKRVGLWRDGDAVAPWEWRRKAPAENRQMPSILKLQFSSIRNREVGGVDPMTPRRSWE